MVFMMLCLKNALLDLPRQSLMWRCIGGLIFLFHVQLAAQTSPTEKSTEKSTEITAIKAVRTDKELVVTAQVKFELPSSIEEAMYKGVSLTFVSELELTRERWYWRDIAVLTSLRQVRISYQALTRRWRVLPWSEVSGQSGLGVQLPQTFETLAEALAVAQRVRHSQIINSADLDDGRHWLSLRYRLDMSQLPKPLQIGLLGQIDWSISANARQRLQLTELRP
jgi:hypothetical protein